MLASISSASLLGASGFAVRVEVHVGPGLPGFRIVGMPDAACREARDRARAAVMSAGFDVAEQVHHGQPGAVRHAQGRAPGSTWPWPSACSSPTSSSRPGPPTNWRSSASSGSTARSGAFPAWRRWSPCSPITSPSCRSRRRPRPTWRPSAVCVSPRRCRGRRRGARVWRRGPTTRARRRAIDEPVPPDLADVRGQPVARRALEIAAAGGHHLLLVGSPGSGKTMLAQRLPGILPPLDRQQALEATMVHSAAGMAMPAAGSSACRRSGPRTTPARWCRSSAAARRRCGPARSRLAHGGVLFLDELGEFAPSVLDGLREPLEEGVIRVARANCHAVLPARFLLVAATNPCPCGGGPPGSCECDDLGRLRYLRRLSGPLLDRFDLRVAVAPPGRRRSARPGRRRVRAPSSPPRVAAARRLAVERAGRLNAELHGALLDEVAPLTARGPRRCCAREIERDRLTGRGYHRVRRVARTIADLRAERTGGADRRRRRARRGRAVAAHTAPGGDAGPGGMTGDRPTATSRRWPAST